MASRHIRKLWDIAPSSWEHPADRAALSAVKQLKGIDELLKILLSATTERSLKLIHLASSVKVSANQYPRLNAMLDEIVDTFDWGYKPDLFVAQNPYLNAQVLGAREPFIVLNNSALRAFPEPELKAILAHEMGHIMSGHALYKTLGWMLAKVSAGFLPGGGLAVAALSAVLAEWDRKSELTADRAELLALQEEEPSCNVLMRMAGAEDLSQVNLNDFFLQAKEYEDQKTVLDSVHKLLNQVWQSHPYPVVRLMELRSWAASGQYKAILEGGYRRRGEPEQSAADELKEGVNFYRDSAKTSEDPLLKLAENLGDEVEKAAGDLAKRFKDLFGPRDVQ